MTRALDVLDAEFEALCELDHTAVISKAVQAISPDAVGSFAFRDQKAQLVRDGETILRGTVMAPWRCSRAHRAEVFRPSLPEGRSLVSSR